METRSSLDPSEPVFGGRTGSRSRRAGRPQGDPLLLASLGPDITLFDSEATRAEALFPFLESQPSMLLIGVSPDVNLVKVWSSRQLREMSMVDLTEVITGETRESE